MPRVRKSYPAIVKAKLAVEATKGTNGTKTAAEIAQAFSVRRTWSRIGRSRLWNGVQVAPFLKRPALGLGRMHRDPRDGQFAQRPVIRVVGGCGWSWLRGASRGFFRDVLEQAGIVRWQTTASFARVEGHGPAVPLKVQSENLFCIRSNRAARTAPSVRWSRRLPCGPGKSVRRDPPASRGCWYPTGFNSRWQFRRSLHWWTGPALARCGVHRPASDMIFRTVSLPRLIPCLSARYSLASVGPKSRYNSRDRISPTLARTSPSVLRFESRPGSPCGTAQSPSLLSRAGGAAGAAALAVASDPTPLPPAPG